MDEDGAIPSAETVRDDGGNDVDMVEALPDHELEGDGEEFDADDGEGDEMLDPDEDQADPDGEPVGDGGAGDTAGDDEGQAQEVTKKLFVGGLARQTTEAAVKDFFSSYGTVLECIVGTTKAGGSKGYGFIRMSTDEEADALMNPPEPLTLEGRVIIVKKHVPRTANNNERKLRLVVSDLDREKTTQQTLREHFSEFGTVTDCNVSMSTVDGKIVSRGLGFVTMSSVADVEAILADNDSITQTIDGAVATVKRVISNKYKQNQLYVGNLQIGVTPIKALRKHFEQFGTVVELLHGRRVGNCKTVQRSYAYIRMNSKEEFDAVIAETEHYVEGRKLEVWLQDTVQDQDRYRRLWFSGLNLEKTTEQDVIDHFNAFGTVDECVIVRDPPQTEGGECKSKGYGFVTMTTAGQTMALLKRREPHTIHDKKLAFNRMLRVKGTLKAPNSWPDSNLKRLPSDMGPGIPPFKRTRGGGFPYGGPYGPQHDRGNYSSGFGMHPAETFYEDSPSGYVPVRVAQNTSPRGFQGGMFNEGPWLGGGYHDDRWRKGNNMNRGGQKGGQRGGRKGGQRGKQRGKGRP